MLKEEESGGAIMLIIFCVFCFFLMSMHVREGEDGILHRMQRFSIDIISPMQEATAKLFEPVREGFDYLAGLRVAYSENEKLRSETRLLKDEIQRLKAAERENATLKSFLDYTQRKPELKFLTAEVVGESPSSWERTIIINAGSDDGVKEYMAVVAEDGLIGRVEQCTNRASVVQLITDTRSMIGVKLESNGEMGFVRGEGGYLVQLELLNQEADVNRGDMVLTSGIGGTCPADIAVGIIEEIGERRPDLSRGIMIKPAVNFTSTEKVMVVLSPEPHYYIKKFEDG